MLQVATLVLAGVLNQLVEALVTYSRHTVACATNSLPRLRWWKQLRYYFEVPGIHYTRILVPDNDYLDDTPAQ